MMSPDNVTRWRHPYLLDNLIQRHPSENISGAGERVVGAGAAADRNGGFARPAAAAAGATPVSGLFKPIFLWNSQTL